MRIEEYYQPADNSGFGFHSSPNDSTGDTVWIQQWIAERAKEMHASWLKGMNLSVASAQAIRNAGLEPINRPYIKTPGGSDGLGGYLNQCELLIRAGFRWQEAPWNEVNLSREMGYWPDPRRIAELWIPWARYITKIGGYASTPALAPGGEYEKDNGGDLVFARRFIERVNELDPTIWDAAIWIAFHNYTLNHPPGYDRDQCAFGGWKFVRDLWYYTLGKRLPMLSTEGGSEIEEHSDESLPPVTREQHTEWSTAISLAPVPPDVFCKVSHWLLTADGNVKWLIPGWYENMQPRLSESIEAMKKLVIVKPEIQHPTGGSTLSLIQQYPEQFKAWEAAGGVENNFRKHLLGIGELQPSSEDLKFLADEMLASAVQTQGAVKNFPF